MGVTADNINIQPERFAPLCIQLGRSGSTAQFENLQHFFFLATRRDIYL